jgi:succinate dehydrogenase / fumarate reductase cytochrome b subunit
VFELLRKERVDAKTQGKPTTGPLRRAGAWAWRAEGNVGSGLWRGVGMWAWLLFRISGLILVAYLFVHIGIISQGQISGANVLDRLFKDFENPALVFLDFLLVAAVLYHGLNGVRIILMDLGYGISQHKLVYVSTMVVAAGFLVAFAVVAAPFIF